MRSLRVLFLAAMAGVGCGENSSLPSDTSGGPECADGIDNDGDGHIDFPDDPGCENPESDTEDGPVRPQCSDNRDNDGDGKIDFPYDPGCIAPQADDETDDCPGPGCPQCGDGVDNDGNGKIDYPADNTGCSSAADPLEFTDDPNACGQGMVIKPLPLSGTDTGTLGNTTSNVTSPCGGGNGLPAVAYILHLTMPRVIIASTDSADTMIDTVLDLRSSMCGTPGAELACHDDIAPGTGTTANKKSKITYSLPAGTYYLIVGGRTPADTGMYSLSVEFFAGEGASCGSTDDCGPGLVCRVPVGETKMSCQRPVCNDGRDDDGDGKIDYPIDPGCTSPDDDDETDSCPSGPDCPACGNGIDDDGDQLIDYPDDPNCVSASHGFEACPQTEPVIVATGPVVSGTTVGKTNDYRPVPGNFNGHLCSTTSTHTAPDVAIELNLPATTSLNLDLTFPGSSFDSSHTLLDASCGGAPIDCRDAPSMPLTNLAAGTYYLVVDGYSSGSGAFNLNIKGTIADGERCDNLPLSTSGALTCGAGSTCKGTAGSKTCQPAECRDMIDNNGDGRIDYPNDPGCTSANDETEDTVCPGANCPACSDGIDNDLDGFIDYPADTSCLSAADMFESCHQSEPIVVATGPVVSGTTAGKVNDYRPVAGSINGHACSTTSTHSAPDVAIELNLPATTSLNLDITFPGTSFDSSHTLLDATCGGTPIDCRDATAMPLTNLAAGTYYMVVDGYSTGSGAFNLNIKGTIANGERCDNLPLSTSGALKCGPGYACKGTSGSKTCQLAECNDMVDNNGDGRTDYPNDPGCTDSMDDSETTVCPGATCPVCSDGIDNDGDGLIDYPNDPGCYAASGTTEGCTQSEPITVVTMPQTTGTTAGAVNDFRPPPGSVNGHLCSTSSTHTAPDVALQLDLPATTTLNLDISFPGSTWDSSHTLLDSTCGGTPIDCRDATAMPLTNLAAGTYYLVVDGYSTASGQFTLNVRGTIANGESCESALAQSGALTCAEGYACDGTPGSRTCQPAQCSDGIDNNGDGPFDFPDDPGCDSPNDNTETTVCPGPMCPACSNGIDDDFDGLIDYPDDPSCFAASGTVEGCMQSEAIKPITAAVTTGTTVGAVNDYVPYCGSATHTAPDVALTLDVPDLEELTLNVTGFDTAHSLLDSLCADPPVFCSDPPSATRKKLKAGRYFVVIDGASTASGAWTLTTSGKVAPGGSCEGALFQAGVFTCAAGLTCAGPMGDRTCQSECSDGVDNNGDGRVDFPEDPGCESGFDSTEDLVCPGPLCPVCSNTLDDDFDGAIDWPQDFACTAASTNSEAFCSIEPNFAGSITMPTTYGTLANRANNYTLSCSSSTTSGNDVAYSLVLPVAVSSLQIDTVGSVAFDTVVSLKDAQCAIEYGCDDDGAFGADNRALLKVPGLPAGNYAVQVDAKATTSNSSYVLNVRGVAVPGAQCTSPLFMTGVLRCPPGTSCTGGTCQ